MGPFPYTYYFPILMLTITSYIVLLLGALGVTLGIYLALTKVVKLI